MKNYIKESNLEIFKQVFVANLFVAIFWDLALISKYTDKSNILPIIFGTFLINGLLCFLGYIMFYRLKSKFHIITWIKENLLLVGVVVVFCVCYFTIIDAWLNLDGYIYYKSLREMKEWDFCNMQAFKLAGHSSQGYTLFLLIGEFITPNNAIGARAMQGIMAIISILCFYGIINEIIKNEEKIEKTMYTAIFAFSPMLLGLLSEFNTDFPVLCFFTWTVYCGVKNKYVLQAICGLLLCFSKETACFIFGFYILGIELYRLIKYRKEGMKVVAKKLFSYDIVLFVCGGLIWILNYLLHRGTTWANNSTISGGESGGYKINSFAFFPEYIQKKFCQMFFINFSWILYILILLLISFIIVYGKKILWDKIKIEKEVIIGIIGAFIAFLAYNCFYITYLHYRYLLPFAFFISFGGVLSIIVLFKQRLVRRIIAGGLSVVLLISNFYTFDPFSRRNFMTQGTGNGEILVPNTVNVDANKNIQLNEKDAYDIAILNTSAMYNSQCVQLGKCFDKTLEEIDYNEKTLIILPCQYRDEYGTNASIFGLNLAGIYSYYWDTKENKLDINNAEEENGRDEERYHLLNYRIISNLSELSQEYFDAYDRIFYIELPFKMDFNHVEFLNGYDIKNKLEIEYIAWKWNVDQIK